MRQYLDARPQIDWLAWIFDNFWAPVMFDKNWNLLSGGYQGAFSRDWPAGLSRGLALLQPHGPGCRGHRVLDVRRFLGRGEGGGRVVHRHRALDVGRRRHHTDPHGESRHVQGRQRGRRLQGYGNPNVATGTVLTADHLRLSITDPSSTPADIARVYEVATH